MNTLAQIVYDAISRKQSLTSAILADCDPHMQNALTGLQTVLNLPPRTLAERLALDDKPQCWCERPDNYTTNNDELHN